MRQKKLILSVLFIFVFVTFFIFAKINAESAHEVKKVNGEEVYVPKDEDKTLKKMTLPAGKKSEMHSEKKTAEEDKKDPHGTMVNTQSMSSLEKAKEEAGHMEKDKHEEMHGAAAEKKEMNGKDMSKSNKLTQFDEEPFDIYRPKGYIWFAAVFVVLLFVIFVFT
ncbi:hypothetical protein [Fluviispira multicolorata]|uniref:Uncharacterized protein n=1 Tax=Fluviispira multicolorata TaxID=2654512 RepID=A0A833JEJ2_9BACT|nr:hypothetical protein [Fluviispira multicolorata]KAB8029975.1 hypothetical protein GCL57_10590 [Fluviispira multicolorata]